VSGHNTGVDFGYDGDTREMTFADIKQCRPEFHCDPTDIVGLLCLRKAKTGGESAIVSSATLYNEILRQRPAYLARLQQGFFYDRKNQNWAEESPVTRKFPCLFDISNGELPIRPFLYQWWGAKIGAPLLILTETFSIFLILPRVEMTWRCRWRSSQGHTAS